VEIERHKAAIRRTTLSRPLRLALEAELVASGAAILDYGCGHGDDVGFLRARGFSAMGWDPYHRPGAELVEASACYLGFVLNVIERPDERIETLKKAWALTRDVLIVGALVTVDARGGLGNGMPFGDGVVTRIGTFQKYFDQRELENILRQTLDAEPIALGMGAFAVFRDPTRATHYLAARVVRRAEPLSAAAIAALLAERRELLQPLVQFFLDRGRWPDDEEAAPFREVTRGFSGLRKVTATLEASATTLGIDFAARRASAQDDLAVVLAIARYRSPSVTPPLDATLRKEVIRHFGTLSGAVKVGDELLRSLGQEGVLRRAAGRARLGKRMPEALYLHHSAVGQLPKELRAYEELARAFVGGTEDANIVKLHLDRPCVSYLSYPDFDADPHPALKSTLVVDMQTFRVWSQSFEDMKNPPILHRKEHFVPESYPQRDRFKRLTEQEERFDLFDGSTGSIGNREQWDNRLRVAGVRIRGHRVLRLKS
jgi:DNA phosphorothioation-associated putative methyltransferase